jgi:hypothetical protein
MTLVRIVPRLNEYPTELVRDLRARGFTVETQYAPHREASADLEIRMEQYPYEGVCKELAEIVAGNDLVILAGAGTDERKIRSIGMVLLSPESELLTASKTAVPSQLNELYFALLRSRLKPERRPALQVARERARQWSSFLKVQSAAKRTAMRRMYIRVSAEAALGIRALKLWWSRINSHRVVKTEPDLVPSMFSLSSPEERDAAEPAPVQEFAGSQPRPKPAMWYSRNWRPISVGALAALMACFLWLFDFSHPTASADQTSHLKPADSQVTQPAPVSHAGNASKVPPSKVAEKSHAVADASDDDFQEVVVRHFTDPSSKASQPTDGVKRVVVVD